MRPLLLLVTAAVVSLVAYLLLFGFVVSRPLVVDQFYVFLDKKLAYAESTPHPKLFIVAGSNARFSHSCAVLEASFGRPCINMGISADVALDWILDETRAELKAGDMVYLPLEYELYPLSRTRMETGVDAAYRFRHDKASLASRGTEGTLRAAFMFSLPTLIHSIGEMGLKYVGVQRRDTVDMLNRQGDEIGHDGAKALPYRAVIRRTKQVMPDPQMLPDNPGGSQAALAAFLDWCRAHHVAAVGGLPTVFNDRPIPDAVPDTLRRFYARHGAGFLVLPNRSQYPRADFYDAAYHLRQSAQMRHSKLVAQGLHQFLLKPS